MVIAPGVANLQYRTLNDIKYFELVAEQVQSEILPGLFINAWGYNGSSPGPTIQVYPGDTVNIRVYNRLPEATSVHWHGLDVPNVMDGVPEIQPSPKIEPGRYFDYRFKIVNQPGTHMYHSHYNSPKQAMMGLSGAFIILNPHMENVQRDYFYMLHEFYLIGLEMGQVLPGVYDIDPYTDDFNFFTMNGRCFPFDFPMAVGYGEIARIRLGNIGMNSHPMHIHGHQFRVTAADGNPIPVSSQLVKNTVLVASGETWDVEFISNNPGRWAFHCHIPHHASNNMTPPMGGMSSVIEYAGY